ncbi:hypothetical protein Avbf_02249 [Armadillidium vulgare]|nr:hypothetical protein Avbf_02249 [Armadillidium vulgare]
MSDDDDMSTLNFEKSNHFLQGKCIHSASFQFGRSFHCSSMKNQNNNSEIELILSSLENKLHQLGMINADGILDVIIKLEESMDLIMEHDLLRVSYIITEALQKDAVKNPIIIEKFGKLLLSQKDLQSVEELLGIYKEFTTSYNSVEEDESYLFSSCQSALIIAYNTCGEYEKARSALEEFDNLDKILDSDQYCNILISAIESGCYDKNLDYLSYEVDFRKLINRLLTSNYLKEAVFLLSMEKSDKPPQSYYVTPSADSVREFIKIKESDTSAVISFCYELVRNKVNEYAFEIALEYSLSIDNSNLSFELFKYLKSKRQLKEHFFWPLFLSKRDPNLEKTLETVKKMNELGVNVGLQTLLYYVIPTLPLDAPEQSLQMLVAHGLSRTKVITPLLCTLISRGKYEGVYNLLKDNRIPFILNSLLYEPLAKIFCRDRKVATELLLSLYRNGLQDEIADISRIINQFAPYVHRASRKKIMNLN